MFIVQSGKVRLFRMVDADKRVHGVMEKGDFFGEMSILEGLPRTISAEAVEDTELIEINSMTFDKMIKGNIEIAIRMLRKLSIRLREAERRIEELQSAGGQAAALRRPARPTVPRAVGRDLKGARLEMEEDGGQAFPLTLPEALVGRFDPVTEMKPDVDLSGVDLKRSVSRRHARIVHTSEGYFITEEVGALNGTYVNGTRLETGRQYRIENGDRIGMGMVKLVFRV